MEGAEKQRKARNSDFKAKDMRKASGHKGVTALQGSGGIAFLSKRKG